ncbi:MAG: HNH endonuclease signature motif containing protein [Candidatus Aenigmarchaeota archaeon]|nr:HNH endonuclease signature motif containing protein [Candidatus Aenigmarchaeota archaeon]
MGMMFGSNNDPKRTLGKRDRKFLLIRAKYKCENPKCRTAVLFEDMEPGHKFKAWSKGGKTTLKNSVCLCHKCNNLQGDYSWATFLKLQGVKDKSISKNKVKGGVKEKKKRRREPKSVLKQGWDNI